MCALVSKGLTAQPLTRPSAVATATPNDSRWPDWIWLPLTATVTSLPHRELAAQDEYPRSESRDVRSGNSGGVRRMDTWTMHAGGRSASHKRGRFPVTWIIIA